ncbi:hypothetical protein [Actinotalea sp. K2]|uniref:hypothetical protein n=1 Tax=Actinotalea sp. K2 TaxID=2939438 RepID=UPI0020182C91|nr:hypothetical protein [Actinotalea sp. K2]MCL3859659.1 hypothetical protein [Actinotalea sp. K2]
MTADLGAALRALARRIPDDAAESWLPDETAHLARAGRRRRALRTATRLLAAAAVVLAVGVTGVSVLRGAGPQPADDDGPVPVLGQATCGRTLEELGWVSDRPLSLDLLEAVVVAPDGAVTVTTRLRSPDALPDLRGADLPRFVAVDTSTGRVVGLQRSDPWTGGRSPRSQAVPRGVVEFGIAWQTALRGCGTDPDLTDGSPPLRWSDYALHGVQAVHTVDQGTWHAVGGPWPVATP